MAGSDAPPGMKPGGYAVAFAAAAWLSVTAVWGVNTVDGAVQIFYAWLIDNGQVTFRDHFLPFPPAGIYIQLGLNKVFGYHLLPGRIYAALQGLITVVIALRLGRRYLSYPFSLVPAVLLIPFSSALGGFPHYNLDSAFFAFVCFFLLDEYRHRGTKTLVFFAALAGAMSSCCKQSMPMVVIPLLVLVLYWRLIKERREEILPHLITAGTGLSLLPALFFIRYALAHGLEEAWSNLAGLGEMKRALIFSVLPGAALLLAIFLTVVALAIRTGRKVPRTAGPLWAIMMALCVAIVFYLPLQFSGTLVSALVAVSLILFVKSRDAENNAFWTMARLFAGLFFAASALSGLDLGHMLLAGAGSVFLAGLMLEDLWRRQAGLDGRMFRMMGATGLGLVFSAGIYLDLALPHLSFSQEPRWKAVSGVDSPGFEGMLTSGEQARELEQTLEWLKLNTVDKDKIFIYPWDLILYVFSGRMPATYDTYLYYEIFDAKTVRRVIGDLELNRPGVAVVRMRGDEYFHVAFDSEARSIEGYLKTYYEPEARYGSYLIMKRRD
jgi:hypothetical protein